MASAATKRQTTVEQTFNLIPIHVHMPLSMPTQFPYSLLGKLRTGENYARSTTPYPAISYWHQMTLTFIKMSAQEEIQEEVQKT